MEMMHPGLSSLWLSLILLCMTAITIKAFIHFSPTRQYFGTFSLVKLPIVGRLLNRFASNVSVLITLKLIVLALFILVIVAGFIGTPIAEKNIATVLTWNIWWAGLVFSILVMGSAWCAVCPWDFIAQLLIKKKLFYRNTRSAGLEMRVPKIIRNLWPAFWLLLILSWLELALGITSSPRDTAWLAILMVFLATLSLILFERKAFCRFFCPIGRTIGCYSQLAPIELRAIDIETCKTCKTLECYHGTEKIEPCPTHLVMGRLTKNSYCTSCGHCVKSCASKNIAWHFREPGIETLSSGQPNLDESWFTLCLLALTGFHGVTMMPFWQDFITLVSEWVGRANFLLHSFTLGMILYLCTIALIYAFTISFLRLCIPGNTRYNNLFSTFSFVVLPLSFSYHLAHTLNHFTREIAGFSKVLSNPFGIDAQALTALEKHNRLLFILLPENLLQFIQAVLIVFGFWIAIRIIRYRGSRFVNEKGISPSAYLFIPMFVFTILSTGFHLWLMAQPMIMRM
ncbi:MAG: 4Fe-4S binding protein [Gammaproteobacteria bacterium]|nr:4Fe-4S binding protein [Gammaproteobacteria bacterium]